MKPIPFLLLMCVPFAGVAQEFIAPATIATERAVRTEKITHAVNAPKDDGSLALPFVDDFSADRFPGNAAGNKALWTDRYAVRNTGMGVNPPTVGVVSFDGTDEYGMPYDFASGSGPADTLTSESIQLAYSPADSVGLSFYFQPKGRAFYGPNLMGDSLVLEFYAPDEEEWIWAWSTLDVQNPEEFTFVYVPIVDERFLKDGFRFRFRNFAFLQGVFSVWNLDYVWLDINKINAEPINNDVAFVRQEFTLLKDFTSMPLSHFAVNPATHMKPSLTVTLRNLNDGPRTLEGNKIRVLHEGTVLADLPNTNSPAIQGGQVLDYTHQVASSPSDFVYDPSLADEELYVDVEILHGVADFQHTASNDTLRFRQHFFTHYAYDDGSAEAGYGVSGNGSEAALRFTNYKPDSIWALQIYTMPYGLDFSGTTFTLVLWEDAGGLPGAVIAEAAQVIEYGEEGYQEAIIYQFEEPVFIPSGSYFAGYRQSNQSEGIIIGLDFNTQGNAGRLFFNDGSGWNPTILAEQASLMIRPMFTTPGYEDLVTGTRRYREETVTLHPNPATDRLNVGFRGSDEGEVTVYDLQGRQVLQKRVTSPATLDVSSLPDGLYVLAVRITDGMVGVTKFAIAR